MGITSLIPGFSMKHRPLPQGPRENLLAPCLVDAGQVFGGIFGFAVPVISGKPQGQDPAPEGAGDQVEALGHGPAGPFFDLGRHQGRNQAPDTAAVDAEDFFMGGPPWGVVADTCQFFARRLHRIPEMTINGFGKFGIKILYVAKQIQRKRLNDIEFFNVLGLLLLEIFVKHNCRRFVHIFVHH
jgi:hypothetical protein